MYIISLSSDPVMAKEEQFVPLTSPLRFSSTSTRRELIGGLVSLNVLYLYFSASKFRSSINRKRTIRGLKTRKERNVLCQPPARSVCCKILAFNCRKHQSLDLVMERSKAFLPKKKKETLFIDWFNPIICNFH